jgi:hypothetical protein
VGSKDFGFEEINVNDALEIVNELDDSTLKQVIKDIEPDQLMQ